MIRTLWIAFKVRTQDRQKCGKRGQMEDKRTGRQV